MKSHSHAFATRAHTFGIALCLLSVTSGFAQTAPKSFEVEQVVTEGKKTVETDAVLTVKDQTFRVEADKTQFKSEAKEFAYADIKTADYSFAKKPMLSGGGAVATALLLSVFIAVPLLFVKKKKHWLAVRTEKEYAIIKLGGNNHRQIVAELKTRGVPVSELKEEGK